MRNTPQPPHAQAQRITSMRALQAHQYDPDMAQQRGPVRVQARAPPLDLRDIQGVHSSAQPPPPMHSQAPDDSPVYGSAHEQQQQRAGGDVSGSHGYGSAQTPPLQHHHGTPDAFDMSTSGGGGGYGGGYDPASADAPPSATSDPRLEESMAKSIVMSEALEALTQRVPIAGQTVSAIIRLMDLCVAARPVAQNARELARLCLDIVDLIEDLVDEHGVLTEDLFKARNCFAAHGAGTGQKGACI